MRTYDRLCRFLSSYPDADATDSFKKEQVREAEKKFIEIENKKRENE